MELAGTAINAAVVAVVGAILAWLAKGRFDAVDHRIDRLEERLDGRIDALGNRLDGRIDRLEQTAGQRFDLFEQSTDQRFDLFEQRTGQRFERLEAAVDALRSDITQVALAVGVRPRAQDG